MADHKINVASGLARRSAASGRRAETAALILLVLILVVCLLGGGSARPDARSLLQLRPFVILCFGALLLLPGHWHWNGLRTPLGLLAAFAVWMIVQLVPLPPGIWLGLPGRQPFAEAALAAGIPQPWRPVSLSPDRTWNSLVSLLIPLTVLTGAARLSPKRRSVLLPVAIFMAGASALLGILQMTVPLQLYRFSHLGFPIGFLANKNHQAVLLATVFPMLRVWTLLPTTNSQFRVMRFLIAVAIGLFLVPVILATGSRAGLVLGVLGLAGAAAIAPFGGINGDVGRQGKSIIVLAAALVFLIILTVFLGRDVAVDRLIQFSDLGQENRIATLPLLIKISGDFFPVGSGLGSFDPIYRIYELNGTLNLTYLNNAHNDPLELLITGGAPAIILLLLLAGWVFKRSLASFRPYRLLREAQCFHRLGGMTVILFFVASLVDYPLRTPLLSALFTLANVWLAQPKMLESAARGGVAMPGIVLP